MRNRIAIDQIAVGRRRTKTPCIANSGAWQTTLRKRRHLRGKSTGLDGPRLLQVSWPRLLQVGLRMRLAEQLAPRAPPQERRSTMSDRGSASKPWGIDPTARWTPG